MSKQTHAARRVGGRFVVGVSVGLTLASSAFAPLLASPRAAQAQTASKPAPQEPDLCVVPPGAQPLLPAKLLEGMGVTDMPVTTSSAEARRFFNQGVSQLHSFWTIEAERSFLQAATLDPDMAMAWWGIAIAAAGDHRPAFQLIRDVNDGGRGRPGTAAAAATGAGPGPGAASAAGGDATVRRTSTGAAIDPSVRAREAIEKARALRDKVSPRERLYIDAQWARRNPASKTRDADYIAAMRTLVVAYPDDDEAKSILGLALLDGYDPISKAPRGHTVEGLRLLNEVVARDDEHFGAHHYLIHGWEGSATPEKAWRACERYPQLVPNVPHALHMPGHIYAQSARVGDAVAAFAAASRNEQTYLAADILYPNGHHGHNVHFLVHALNLDGRYQESLRQVQHLLSFKETPRERTSANQRVTWRQGYFSLVKTLVRFERWDDILDGRTLPVYDRPEQQAWRQWAIGLAHSAKGHTAEAQTALAELTRAVSAATATTQPLQIAQLELEATIAARAASAASAADARRAAYALFRQAADREARLTYTEPPAYPRPVAEGWAIVAASLGDHAVADEAYREALVREPGSGRAYFGRAAALEAIGKRDESREALAQAEKAWARADRELPQWRQVKPAGATPSASVGAAAQRLMRRATLIARLVVFLLPVLLLAGCAHRYDARGVVLRVEPEARQVTVSHEAIPGYMEAMVMPLDVRAPASLDGLGPGDRIAFRLRVSRARSWIDRLRTISAPRTDAGLLESPVRPRLVPVGASVPDFALVDQHGARVSLAALRGQVVAVTFIYTRCPLPDYCPLMTANFKAIARQFAPRLGRDLTLLTVTFDPGFDTSAVLADYARAQGAERPGWHFLTGSAAEIGEVCHAFGLEFWPEEGLITHALQTAVIDRDGRLAGTIEGKEYGSRQLADLIDSVLAR